jgi:hypothetical protein
MYRVATRQQVHGGRIPSEVLLSRLVTVVTGRGHTVSAAAPGAVTEGVMMSILYASSEQTDHAQEKRSTESVVFLNFEGALYSLVKTMSQVVGEQQIDEPLAR